MKPTDEKLIEMPGDKLGRKWIHPESDVPAYKYLRGRAYGHHKAGFEGLCATCQHGEYGIDDVVCSLLPPRFDSHGLVTGVIGMYPPGYENAVLAKCETRKVKKDA